MRAQLVEGYRDPSEWTYERMRDWVRKHCYPIERDAVLGDVKGKVALSHQAVIFTSGGEAVGFDLSQLRSIEIVDDSVVSLSYSIIGEVRNMKLTVSDSDNRGAVRFARKTLELDPTAIVARRKTIPPWKFETEIAKFREVIRKWSGPADRTDDVARDGLHAMWDEDEVLLTESQMIMSNMVAYELYRRSATFTSWRDPLALQHAEKDMQGIKDEFAELGLMPK